MNTLTKIIINPSIILFTVLISACSVSMPKNYFLLEADKSLVTTTSSSSSVNNNDSKVGVMPIKLAEHIDKNNFVVYKDNSVIDYKKDELWAESIQDNLLQVIVDYLALQKGQTEVIKFPWRVAQKPGTIVTVEMKKLGIDELNQSLILEGIWTLEKENNIEDLRFSINVPLLNVVVSTANEKQGVSPKVYADAYTTALYQLSQQIYTKL